MVKRTLQEIADFFDMAAAVDKSGDWYMYRAKPILANDLWQGNGSIFCGLPRDLVGCSGDWRDSLTLPESWTKEPPLPFKEGELVVHLPSGNMYPWAAQYAPDSHRRPTEAEWAVLRGEG